jgi:hypothetical protein
VVREGGSVPGRRAGGCHGGPPPFGSSIIITVTIITWKSGLASLLAQAWLPRRTAALNSSCHPASSSMLGNTSRNSIRNVLWGHGQGSGGDRTSSRHSSSEMTGSKVLVGYLASPLPQCFSSSQVPDSRSAIVPLDVVPVGLPCGDQFRMDPLVGSTAIKKILR